MTDFQPILLFPVRDAFARKQFLLAALIMLAAMIIPIIPTLILLGYGARIMRQIIDEDKEPTMLEWQGIEWGQLLTEGARLFAAQLVYMLPVLLLLGCGFVFFMSSPFLLTLANPRDPNSISPFGFVTFEIGMGVFLLAMLLGLPLGVIAGAAQSHVVAQQSFEAALRVREWWPIFRAGLGYFIGAYLFTMVAGFVFSLAMQIAMITVVLICIIPFLMFGYTAYLMLVLNALFAKAYAIGRKAVPQVEHAPA